MLHIYTDTWIQTLDHIVYNIQKMTQRDYKLLEKINNPNDLIILHREEIFDVHTQPHHNYHLQYDN